MNHKVRLMLVPALVVPALLAAALLPGAAYAKSHKGPKTPKPVTVICQGPGALSGNISGTPTPALSGCDQPTATGGSGTFTGFAGASGTLTITWSGTGTTTASYSSTLPSSKGNKCATGSTEVILHGRITGNTPTSPSTDGGVKGGVHTKLCFDAAGNLSLLAGQRFKL